MYLDLARLARSATLYWIDRVFIMGSSLNAIVKDLDPSPSQSHIEEIPVSWHKSMIDMPLLKNSVERSSLFIITCILFNSGRLELFETIWVNIAFVAI